MLPAALSSVTCQALDAYNPPKACAVGKHSGDGGHNGGGKRGGHRKLA